jgi:hypothetical protein
VILVREESKRGGSRAARRKEWRSIKVLKPMKPTLNRLVYLVNGLAISDQLRVPQRPPRLISSSLAEEATA